MTSTLNKVKVNREQLIRKIKTSTEQRNKKNRQSYEKQLGKWEKETKKKLERNTQLLERGEFDKMDLYFERCPNEPRKESADTVLTLLGISQDEFVVVSTEDIRRYGLNL